MLAPLRGFWDTQSEVARMFNDMVRGVLGRRLTDTASRTWSPQLEAYAKDGDLVLHYHLPGVGLEDVDINLDGNLLTIQWRAQGHHRGGRRLLPQ